MYITAILALILAACILFDKDGVMKRLDWSPRKIALVTAAALSVLALVIVHYMGWVDIWKMVFNPTRSLF